MTGERQPRILSVQAMRGLAAAAVALYHTSLILAQGEYGGRNGFDWLSGRGWLGVNFFFVLSGFIILMAHQRDVDHKEAAPRYLWRRFARVYPVYWVFLTAYVLAALAGFGHPDFSWAPLNLASAYALFPFVDAPSLPLKVAWTLVYEVQFYAIFTVLILSRRAGLAVMAAWLAGIVLLPDPKPAVFSAWNLHFIAGMGAYWISQRLDLRYAVPVAVAGAVIVVAAGWLAGDRIARVDDDGLLLATIAAGFAMVIVGAVRLERQYRLRPPRWLLVLGDASYSIYLVHSAALSAVALIYSRWPVALPFPVVFASAFVLSVAAGVVAHFVVERPLLSALRRFRPSGRSRIVGTAPGMDRA